VQDFKFRLGTVLKLRQRQEDAAMSAVSSSRLHLAREQSQLEELHREAVRNDNLRQELRRGQVDVRSLQDADRYRDAISHASNAQCRKVNAAESVVDECVRHHLERRTEKKALEKLKERRAGEHQREVLAQEQDEMDEVAVRGWRGEK
jgi:flagellar export protein FliJ